MQDFGAYRFYAAIIAKVFLNLSLSILKNFITFRRLLASIKVGSASVYLAEIAPKNLLGF